MTTEKKIQQAIFPDLPRDLPFVIKDKDDKFKMHPQWELFFDQLTNALQVYFKPEGFVMPQQTPANIALLTAIASVGNILYDSTNNEFKGNINGTWKTFTLT